MIRKLKNATTVDGDRRNGGRVRGQNRAGGFTVVEVVVATTILVLVIVVVLTLNSQGFVMLQSMRESARANQILHQKMEELRLLPFSEIQALSETFSDAGDTQGRYKGFVRKQIYRTNLAGTTVSLKVTLTLTWAGRNGTTRSHSLTTVFSSTGLNESIF